MKLTANIIYKRLLLAIAGGIVCLLLASFNIVGALDNIAYDTANELVPLSRADDIVIVAIDERSLLELGRWPWPREKHVELLRRLRVANSGPVAIDIVFAEPDTEYPEVDRLLAAEIASHSRVVLPVYIGQADRSGGLLEIEPVRQLADAAARTGHVHIEVDNDGVARRVFLKEGLVKPHWEHFTIALARVLGMEIGELPGRVENVSNQSDSETVIARNNENFIPLMGAAGTVDTVSYVDVIRGVIPKDILKNKIIFVGATAAGHADNISTSMGQISGVEINANIFHAWREGRLAKRISPELNATFCFLITFFTIIIFTRLQPRALLVAVVVCVLVVPLVAILLLRTQQLWFSPMPVVVTVILAYPLWNWLRLETAVAFMHQQLGLLQKENSASDDKWTWQHLENTAEFLQSLERLQQWTIKPVKIAKKKSVDIRRWGHSATQSKRIFSIEGETRLLSLTWNPKYRDARRNLDKIFPAEVVQAELPAFGADFIDEDIVHLKNAYQQAKHHRELIGGTMAQLTNGVLLADSSGTILLLNDQAKHLLALEEDIDQLIEAFKRLEFNSENEVGALLSGLTFEGTAFDRETRSLDGNTDILCRGRMISLDRPLLLISLTDVTDLKASEKNRAEALNFLSHDLRAPLTSVLALIEGAKNDGPDQVNGQLLENIERYVQNNLDYSENFTQLARLESGLSVVDECDAQSLIDNAVSLIFHAASKRGIKFDLSICDDEVWVNCNRGVLERAILNLLDNAIKHSDDNSRISVSLSCNDNHAIIAVADSGCGISNQDIDRIFDSFQQGSSAVSGVGLGLRFVVAAVQSHHGTVSVDSEVDVGSTFTLEIPLGPTSVPTSTK